MKLTLARPEHAEYVSDFYQAIHGPEFPHQEMFSPKTVRQLLADEELAVVIASRDRHIIGCAIGFPRAWNQSLEIGTLSVDDVSSRSEIGKALFEAMRRLGFKSYGVVYFRASSEKSFRRARKIGATAWGFRPAPGSSDFNDAELLLGFFNPNGPAQRVQPPNNVITERQFAARIVEGLPNADPDFPYPKNFPVGSPRGTGMPVISGRVWPTYHSRGNYVVIESSAGPYPVEIIREFAAKVRKKGVSDIRLALPVNQEQAFVDLVDFGFRPTAYLPGWFLQGSHRFDCVELVAGLRRPQKSPESFLEKACTRILDGLDYSDS
jgi:hypothetical protein